jgi:integrase
VNALTRGDIERLLVDVKEGKTAAQRSGKSEKRPAGSLPTGGAGAAAQCVTLVSTLLAFAVKRGLREANPARGIKKPPIRKMERFLSDDEIARLSAALEFEATSSGNPYASAAIKLLLLTGCRRGEILNLYGRMLTSKGNAFVSQTARRARRLSISTRPHLSYSGVSRTLRVTPMSLLDRKMHRLSPDWIDLVPGARRRRTQRCPPT